MMHLVLPVAHRQCSEAVALEIGILHGKMLKRSVLERSSQCIPEQWISLFGRGLDEVR